MVDILSENSTLSLCYFRGRLPLQQSLDETQEIVHDVTKVAEAVIDGNFEITLSNDTNLNIAINKMIQAFSKSAKDSERDFWLKTGQANLAEILRGDQDVVSLSMSAISYLCKYLNAKVGVIYLLQGKTLKLIGSYAYNKRKSLNNEFSVGEGLVGQAVLEKETLIVDNLPDEYMTVSSGLGESTASSVLVSPMMVEGDVIGVIEIGKFAEFEDVHLDLMKLCNQTIAIAIQSAQSRERMNQLLKDSQEKSQELEAQSEKLTRINDDLESQAKALKASEDELKAQSDTLQTTNEELEEKTQELERQKHDIEKQNIELAKSTRMIEDKAKELQQSSKYKSEFLSNMSHELRTPLNSLLILSKMLIENEDGNLTEEQINTAGIIHSSGKDLLNLINDILDLSKIEVGKLQVKKEVINIQTIISGLYERLKPLATNKSINFSFDIASDVIAELDTDPMRLEQILKNLLSNAIKFTDDEGEVTLKIYKCKDRSKIPIMKGENIIAFEVTDNGIGIAKEDIGQIFEAFQQADGTTSRRFEGTGLGLTISKKLAHLLGGEIIITSEVDKGTTVTLLLAQKSSYKDFVVKNSQVSESPSKTKSKKGTTKKSTKPHFLIIEDDLAFLNIIDELLTKRGIEHTSLSTGHEALEFVGNHTPSAIIMDLGLPDMSGLELLDIFNSNDRTKDIPIHVISASDYRETSLEKGALGFISKPVEKDALTQLLEKSAEMISGPVKEILIVEDDDIQRQHIHKLIDSDNVTISEATSGKRAIKIVKENQINCMILDLNLPDISGLEVLERISKDKNISQPLVIIYTSKDITAEEEQQLNKYTPSIVIKSADAPQRLMDEVTLFLTKLSSDVDSSADEFKQLLSCNNPIVDGKKVLLVDDDMRNNIALGAYLRKQGFEVVVADNGEMALEKLESQPDVALVLMDIMMPIMDGYVTMETIRRAEQYQHLPIIALTAKAMAEDRKKCLDSGANDYLTKPLDTDKLLQTMKVWLKE